MRLIDADELCKDRVSNDPVVIAAKAAKEIIAKPTKKVMWGLEFNSKGWILVKCPECGNGGWVYGWTNIPKYCKDCGVEGYVKLKRGEDNEI